MRIRIENLVIELAVDEMPYITTIFRGKELTKLLDGVEVEGDEEDEEDENEAGKIGFQTEEEGGNDE